MAVSFGYAVGLVVRATPSYLLVVALCYIERIRWAWDLGGCLWL